MAEPNQILQLTGAVMILVAYLLLQVGALDARSLTFAGANMLGAGILAYEAGSTRQWGFLLLEGTWSLISLVALVVQLARRSRLS